MTSKYPKVLELVPPRGHGQDARSLILKHWDSYSIDIKESLLVHDVLAILSGVEGSIINIDNGRVEFAVQEASPVSKLALDSDSALFVLVTQVLHVALLKSQLLQHLERLQDTCVAHAFLEAVQQLLQQLESKVAQYEHGTRDQNQSLSRLKIHLSPEIATLEFLNRICNGATENFQLIDNIHSACNMHDPGDITRSLANQLQTQVMDALCLEIDLWIHHGVLLHKSSLGIDPCGDSFQFYPDKVPTLLGNVGLEIFKAGKYATILKQFQSKSQRSSRMVPLRFTTPRELEASVLEACTNKSRDLLQCFMQKFKFEQRLESMINVMLVQRADWIGLFLDALKEPGLEQSKLQEALASSTCSRDAFIRDYVLIPCYNSLSDWHMPSEHVNGQGFDLDFVTMEMQIPQEMRTLQSFMQKITLTFSKVFRLQLLLKRLERSLTRAWFYNQKSQELGLEPHVTLKVHYTLLGISRMLDFCKRVQGYASLVIQQGATSVLNGIKTKSLDEITAALLNYQQQLEFGLLLNDLETFKALCTTLAVAKTFALHLGSFFNQVSPTIQPRQNVQNSQSIEGRQEMLQTAPIGP
ncbi:bifunctional Gamma tubulin complex component protein [Babesia duncani]|uniref:Spindle pole body component n=1 Tax=Babesia duncani TaxID=323732 RepID=A0AAD9PPB6_9APIC|nr:bifunctional Gamma tubulin complex component protein [Babesia duncani]